MTPQPLNLMAVFTVLVSWLSLMLIHRGPMAIGLFLLSLVACLMRGRWDISRTQWLVACLLGLLLSLLLWQLGIRRELATGLFSRNLYPVVLSLGLATLPALVRRHTRREYWATMVISGIFFLLCGLTLEPLTLEFAVLSALWTLGFLLSSRQVLTGTLPGLAANLTLIPSLILLVLTAAAFAYSERQVNFLLRLLSAGADVSLAFPAQSRLNSMMASETNPAVVARCFSRNPSTYLAARVYTQYQDATWSEFGPSQNVNGSPRPGGFHYSLTDKEPDPGAALSLEQFEVNASPIVLFAPRDAAWLEVDQSPLALLSGHLLEVRGGGNQRQPYTVARLIGQDLAPPESPEYMQACLQLPPNLNPVVQQRALEVLGDGSPWQKGLRGVEWFHQNFTYGFGYDFSSKADPVSDFLINRPQAHCELFAASLTLMLRTQKIPARYVNGFVCVEPGMIGDYYVIRVRDAHAWVELWDGQAWRTLDPTPPRAIQPPQDWSGWFDSLREAWNFHTRRLGRLDWKGWLALLWAKKAYLGGALMLLALWKMRKLSWLPQAPQKSAEIPQSAWIRQLSQHLESRQLARQSWETLLHWAERLRQNDLPELAQWLERYSAFRYGGGSDRDLGPQLEQLLKNLQNPPS